VDKEGKPL